MPQMGPNSRFSILILKFRYGSGSLEGVISQELLQVGPIKVKDQGFAESTKEPGLSFAMGRFDGIFGLAYDTIAVAGTVPPFYKMIQQNLVEEPLFGVYMGDQNDGGDGGEITFGSINPARFKGEISWAPVIRKAYWEVAMDSVFLAGKQLNVVSTSAAIDTGTSLIAMPVNEATALNTAIGAKSSWNGQYTLPCDQLDKLPVLVLTMGGKEYSLTGKDYVLQVGGTCISSFMY